VWCRLSTRGLSRWRVALNALSERDTGDRPAILSANLRYRCGRPAVLVTHGAVSIPITERTASPS